MEVLWEGQGEGEAERVGAEAEAAAVGVTGEGEEESERAALALALGQRVDETEVLGDFEGDCVSVCSPVEEIVSVPERDTDRQPDGVAEAPEDVREGAAETLSRGESEGETEVVRLGEAQGDGEALPVLETERDGVGEAE